MRVKRRQHAINRSFNEVFVTHLFNIFSPDTLKHVTEQGQLTISLVSVF